MVLAQELLDQMEDMPDAPDVMLVKKQVVSDIIRYMPWKVESSRPYYDRIWGFFDDGTLEAVGEGVFDFLKDQMTYIEEDDDAQVLSTPKEMLERGACDCKGYALFVGGVVDAINRNSGRPEIPWCLRFVPSAILGTKIGHVFVVLDPGGSEVWVDPVLSRYDEHPIYLVKRDVYVGQNVGETVGALDTRAAAVGSTSAENSLLSELYGYQQGVIQAVAASETTNTINTITQGILNTVSSALPIFKLAKVAVGEIDVAVNDIFPANSAAGVAIKSYLTPAGLSPFGILASAISILSGRQFNSDQYWGAALYYFYVEGQNITNANQVSDSMVAPALKWFIDRTGVFISGRQHIMGLIAGVSTYTSYAAVNGDTTTNVEQVQAAVSVAQEYWTISGQPSENYQTFDANLKGAWAVTVGVFDTGIATIAAAQGETSEAYAAQTGDQYAINENEGLPATAPSWQAKVLEIYKNPLAWVLTGVAAVGLGLLIFEDD